MKPVGAVCNTRFHLKFYVMYQCQRLRISICFKLDSVGNNYIRIIIIFDFRFVANFMAVPNAKATSEFHRNEIVLTLQLFSFFEMEIYPI